LRKFSGAKIQNDPFKQDLSDLSGMSKDSVIRILHDFQDDGIIRVTDNEIELLDPEGLKRISRFG